MLIRLGNVVLSLLLGLVCAYWFWKFTAPPAVEAQPVDTTDAAYALDMIRRAAWFGSAGAVAPIPQPALELALRGVFAAREGAMAVIAVAGEPAVAVRAGDEVAPGVRLLEVRADHVLVLRHGVAHRLDLPEHKRLGAPPVTVIPRAGGR